MSEKPMNSPQLTLKIENKILSIIEASESASKSNGSLVASKHYVQLADLYHFHGNFKGEAEILKRFAALEWAANDDLVAIYDRIERASQLCKHSDKRKPGKIKLELVAIADEKDDIALSVPRKTLKRVNSSRSTFSQNPVKVLSVCSAFTGRSDQDEIVELSCILFEYAASASTPATVLETYTGQRSPIRSIPNKTQSQFRLELSQKNQTLDLAKVSQLFEQADLVVSHNDAEVERKLLATLLPQVVDVDWHCSQIDIPWQALGFKTRSLTQLVASMGEKAPRTSLERASAIVKLLTNTEPHSQQTFLERIYNMKPMKALDWTPELIKQRQKIANAKRDRRIKQISLLSVLAGLTYAASVIFVPQLF